MEFLRKLINKVTLKERHESYGNDYPDKTFYIIRVDYKMAGIMAIVKSTLSHIVYAYHKNYIPVIDLLNCECQYYDANNPSNVWDVYFKQPSGYSLSDIQYAKHVIISKNTQVPSKKYTIYVDALYSSEKKLASYRHWYNSFIHFNLQTQEYVEQKYKEIFPIGEKVLGVLARGTDYLEVHPKGHPVQPQPEVIINKAQSLMQEKKYQYLFLATEDQKIYDLFKQQFHDKLLCVGQKLLSGMSGAKFIADLDQSKKLNQKYDVLNYLASLYILSKCSAFIGGCTAGTIGAYMMSNMFEYEYFWNLGKY